MLAQAPALRREVIACALYLPGLEMTLTAQLYGPTDNGLTVLDRGHSPGWPYSCRRYITSGLQPAAPARAVCRDITSAAD